MHSIRFAGLAFVMVAAILAVAGLPGCSSGPAKGEVRGKLTFKGKPVKEGSIEFLNPTKGGAGETKIGPEGSYEFKGGLVVGDYVVIVSPLYHEVDTDPGKTPKSMMPKPAPDIPQKYRNQDSTPLRASVKAGKNEFDFELKP